MLKTKAILRCKDNDFEPKDCVIEKVIRLDSDDFQHYCGNIYEYRDFIKENSEICGRDADGNQRCLLVLDRNGSDGILIQSEGYDYARYTCFMPGAKYLVEAYQETQSMRLNGQTQADEPCELSVSQLFEIKMERNYDNFVSGWRELSSNDLIERAGEIAVTKDIWHSIRDGSWDVDYCEYLMRFENPLEVVRDYCFEQQVQKGEAIDVGSAGWNLLDKRGLEETYPLDENYSPPDQSAGMKM